LKGLDNNNLTRQAEQGCSVEGVVDAFERLLTVATQVVEADFKSCSANGILASAVGHHNANDNQQVPLSDSSDG
jgi:hypothetical protein